MVERFPSAIPTFRDQRDTERHAASFGKLKGVGEQISDHLLEALRIGEHVPGQLVVQLDTEGKALRVRNVPESTIDIMLQIGKAQLGDIQRDSSGFDLRKIQNVVDERK